MVLGTELIALCSTEYNLYPFVLALTLFLDRLSLTKSGHKPDPPASATAVAEITYIYHSA